MDILNQSAGEVHSGAAAAAGERDRLDAALLTLQRQIEAIYQLEPTPAIAPFVRVEGTRAREQLIVRQSVDSLELVVLLPEPSADALLEDPQRAELDAYLGAVEGISHFVHLADRARTRLPTTLLELELQAEVDKFALLAAGLRSGPPSELFSLHRRLYEDVSYLHEHTSERGQRYRLANDLAARLWSQLLRSSGDSMVSSVLRRFYRASQAEKIRMARAA